MSLVWKSEFPQKNTHFVAEQFNMYIVGFVRSLHDGNVGNVFAALHVGHLFEHNDQTFVGFMDVQ